MADRDRIIAGDAGMPPEIAARQFGFSISKPGIPTGKNQYASPPIRNHSKRTRTPSNRNRPEISRRKLLSGDRRYRHGPRDLSAAGSDDWTAPNASRKYPTSEPAEARCVAADSPDTLPFTESGTIPAQLQSPFFEKNKRRRKANRDAADHDFSTCLALPNHPYLAPRFPKRMLRRLTCLKRNSAPACQIYRRPTTPIESFKLSCFNSLNIGKESLVY